MKRKNERKFDYETLTLEQWLALPDEEVAWMLAHEYGGTGCRVTARDLDAQSTGERD